MYAGIFLNILAKGIFFSSGGMAKKAMKNF